MISTKRAIGALKFGIALLLFLLVGRWAIANSGKFFWWLSTSRLPNPSVPEMRPESWQIPAEDVVGTQGAPIAEETPVEPPPAPFPAEASEPVVLEVSPIHRTAEVDLTLKRGIYSPANGGWATEDVALSGRMGFSVIPAIAKAELRGGDYDVIASVSLEVEDPEYSVSFAPQHHSKNLGGDLEVIAQQQAIAHLNWQACQFTSGPGIDALVRDAVLVALPSGFGLADLSVSVELAECTKPPEPPQVDMFAEANRVAEIVEGTSLSTILEVSEEISGDGVFGREKSLTATGTAKVTAFYPSAVEGLYIEVSPVSSGDIALHLDTPFPTSESELDGDIQFTEISAVPVFDNTLELKQAATPALERRSRIQACHSGIFNQLNTELSNTLQSSSIPIVFHPVTPSCDGMSW